MNLFTVCKVNELPPGQRRIVEVSDDVSIGVFNIDGKFYAIRNTCPHRKAPLCRGRLGQRITSDGPGDAQMSGPQEIISCPWHGWEFNVTTGQSVFNPHQLRIKTYQVTIEPPSPCGAPEDCPGIDTYPVQIADGIVTVLLKRQQTDAVS